MGQRELEAALRREGEAKAQEIWQQAESEADQLRSTVKQQLETEQQSLQHRISAETAGLLEAARTTVQQQSQLQRLNAEQQLAQRLERLAEGLLAEIGKTGGTSLFRHLAAEIPQYSWQLVEAHPRDQQIAQKLFPQAEVRSREQITGGLIVQDLQGQVVIINTLQKRLKHLWTDLLPELMTKLRPQVKSDETLD